MVGGQAGRQTGGGGVQAQVQNRGVHRKKFDWSQRKPIPGPKAWARHGENIPRRLAMLTALLQKARGLEKHVVQPSEIEKFQMLQSKMSGSFEFQFKRILGESVNKVLTHGEE